MQITSYKSGELNPVLECIQSRALPLNSELVTGVTNIVDGVRNGGDEAVIDFTAKFDGVTLRPETLRVNRDELKRSASKADARVIDAFRVAIRNVRTFHEQQRETNWTIDAPDGVRLGLRIVPLDSVGLYVPGGKAAYPSSLIMNTVPAQVAGVPRIVVATPPGTLEQSPVVAALLEELHIEEVYQVGGAQAIAALAFGTENIRKVDKIVGPGNAYVALAKKLVYGTVGIDSIAGPTEVVVLADDTANPRFIAADLLAQAEHDELASAICITTSEALAEEVLSEVTRQLAVLERRTIAESSIRDYGAIFVVDSIAVGCELVNQLAPEHLEIMTSDDEQAAAGIRHAGAIFFGPWSSEPVGDYLAGPNHVLPTVGTARFSSPLGVYDFVRRQSVIRYSRDALLANSELIASMADTERLTAHKRAILIRTEDSK